MVGISSWPIYKLSDVCRMKYGKMPAKKDIIEKGYPVFSGYGVTGYHKDYHFKESEIVVIARGIGGTGDIKMSPPFCFLTNIGISLQIAKPEIVDKKFLYYRLASSTLRNLRTGTAQPQIIIADLEKYQVKLPPLPAQRKIAAILSAYDDLIENNNRRIMILEDMAKLIYQEWFVDFHFLGHENVKMVESPSGNIPEGWKVIPLNEAMELVYGKALKESDRKGGDVPVYGSSGIIGFHNESLAKGPGIIVGRKGNVGSVHWSDVDFYAIDTVYYVRTKLPLQYVFYDLQTQNFINSDAAVPGLSRRQAYSLPFLVPDEVVLKAFVKIIESIFLGLTNLRNRNENLRKARELGSDVNSGHQSIHAATNPL